MCALCAYFRCRRRNGNVLEHEFQRGNIVPVLNETRNCYVVYARRLRSTLLSVREAGRRGCSEGDTEAGSEEIGKGRGRKV